eukprot:3937329-Amphidinium_carterae.1
MSKRLSHNESLWLTSAASACQSIHAPNVPTNARPIIKLERDERHHVEASNRSSLRSFVLKTTSNTARSASC